MAHDNPEVWVLAYEQLPPLVRWTLIIVTGGLIALAGWVVRRYDKRVSDLENARFQTREEATQQIDTLRKEIREGFRSTHERIDHWFKQ